MKYFIFRNSTVEPLFSKYEAAFSGYDDISGWEAKSEILIWFYIVPFKRDLSLLIDEIESYYNNILLITSKIPKSKPFYVFTLSILNINKIITGDHRIKETIKNFNTNIISLANQRENIKVIDVEDFFIRYPEMQIVDWKFYYISKMIVNPKLSTEFQFWFDGQLDAINMIRKKCLVLDLDNTLWGGVLGEDGINGIKIGIDYPGNAFYDFQAALLELSKAGIILTVCSKNNEKDVLEAWDKNPNILIKKEHLVAYRINWNNKAENISDIIRQLNIGADSVVFVDDNPTERELVRQFIPAIEVPDFPGQPYKLPYFIREITEKYFRTYKLTDEDKVKTLQYKKNNEREDFKKEFNDFSEYLKSLEIKLEIAKAIQGTIPRIAQMTQKTNQFNLTTKRYTETNIIELIKNKNLIYTLKAGDRFGDNGITGLIIINTQNKKSAHIDTLLLSCRILGKDIEKVFVKVVLKKVFNCGFSKITAEFIPTAKNSQVVDLYEKLSFSVSELKENKSKFYILNKDNFIFDVEDYYEINFKDDEENSN